MSMVFRYKETGRPDKTQVKSPLIPITLYGDEPFETMALLDSGADLSAMHVSMAEALGLNLKGNTQSSFGVGGTTKSKLSKVRINVKRRHETYTFEIPIMVIYDDFQFPVLLGREGFFDKFKITFDQTTEKVTLKRYTRR